MHQFTVISITSITLRQPHYCILKYAFPDFYELFVICTRFQLYYFHAELHLLCEPLAVQEPEDFIR